MPRTLALILAALVIGATAGCLRTRYDPAKATPAYPNTRLSTKTVDVQVFREGAEIELINATANSYRDFRLWINQRYTREVDQLLAGESIRISLWDFWDERGEVFNAGGVWRTEQPTPVRLVEIEADGVMVGLITIRAEPADA